MKNIFFVWKFTITVYMFSWLAWLPIILNNLSTTESPAGAILFMVGGFGPSIIGLALLLIEKRNQGDNEVWSRIFSLSRIGWKWLSISLLIYPLVFALSVLIDYLLVSSTLPEAEQLNSMMVGVVPFLGNTLIIFLLGPLAEEIGWRGYLLEKLQKQISPIKSTLLIGVIWWAWHLPLFFMPSTLHGSQGLFSFFSVGYFFTVLSYSIIFTWLYNNSNRSILVAILAHFSINFTIATMSPFSGVIFAISTIILLLVGVFLYYRDKNLGFA
jgi:membrane protease YdiL (CAAX protease family)